MNNTPHAATLGGPRAGPSESAVYPIAPPPEAPSYVVESVQNQCNSALRSALRGDKLEYIEAEAAKQARSEAHVLRQALDSLLLGGDNSGPNGVRVAQDWWLRWGYRTVVRALEDAAQLARFRDALARGDFSHVTSGHSVSPNSYHVYAADPASPSGCHHVASAPHTLPGAEQVLAESKHGTCQGAQRGEMAVRAAMRG
jgi:hypothetical protein